MASMRPPSRALFFHSYTEREIPMTRKTNTRAQADESRLYEYVWRNKWLTAKAESIGDMIGSLQAAADELREMKSRGVTLDQGGGVGDDYATLITDDPSVAEEFGFDDRDEGEEDERDGGNEEEIDGCPEE